MKRSNRKDFLLLAKKDYDDAKIRRYNKNKLKSAKKTLRPREFKVYCRDNNYWIKDL